MMELIKQHIHMNRQKSHVTSQMTLDDDFNVPDSMDDVEDLILNTGEIQIESVRNLGEKAGLKGKLEFRVLYRTTEGQIMTLAGNLPFEETINLPGVEENDYLQVTWELDDLSVGVIHSRKLSVNALITLHIQAENIEDTEAAYDARFDGNVELLKQNLDIAVLSVRRKDTFRMKETLTVSGNRPDVENLLWQDIKIRGINTKPLDGRIHIDGELMVFVIYTGGDGQMPVQCLEESIPFSGEVELTESNEDMIPFISVKLSHKDLEVTPDADGEMREIVVDAVLEMDIRLFEEEQAEILSDLYALDRELLPETGVVCFDQIRTKNLLKHRIQEKIGISGGPRILQICHSDGTVKIDEIQVQNDGLLIDGVLEVELLYLTADDTVPVASFRKILPFQVSAEAVGITENHTYQAAPGLEQISAVVLGSDQVEIKAVITMDILVLGQLCEQVILNVKEEPIDVEKLKKMPGIVGYIVKAGDSLWKIAREFHTSVDEIMAANNLSDSSVHSGDKLILVKTVRD